MTVVVWSEATRPDTARCQFGQQRVVDCLHRRRNFRDGEPIVEPGAVVREPPKRPVAVGFEQAVGI